MKYVISIEDESGNVWEFEVDQFILMGSVDDDIPSSPELKMMDCNGLFLARSVDTVKAKWDEVSK